MAEDGGSGYASVAEKFLLMIASMTSDQATSPGFQFGSVSSQNSVEDEVIWKIFTEMLINVLQTALYLINHKNRALILHETGGEFALFCIALIFFCFTWLRRKTEFIFWHRCAHIWFYRIWKVWFGQEIDPILPAFGLLFHCNPFRFVIWKFKFAKCMQTLWIIFQAMQLALL